MTPPAAVVAAISSYLCRSIRNLDETHADEVIAPGLIAAAAEAGWVLVSKDALTEQADFWEHYIVLAEPYQDDEREKAVELIRSLRSALGNGGVG
jgi:hypothetical protein